MASLIVRSRPTMEISADVRMVAESLPNPKSVMGYWYKRCLRGIHDMGDISPNVDVYLAYVNGKVAGVAIVNNSSANGDGYIISTLELIIVDPSIQGCGVGSKLLHAIIPTYSCLFLEVSADNHRAIELYRRFGFRMIDARGDYIVMRRVRHD